MIELHIAFGILDAREFVAYAMQDILTLLDEGVQVKKPRECRLLFAFLMQREHPRAVDGEYQLISETHATNLN